MNKEEKIKKLEKKLEKLRSHNQDAWEMYGSELCAGAMIDNEKKLEEEIEKLKKEK
jgi:hypothetical protein